MDQFALWWSPTTDKYIWISMRSSRKKMKNDQLFSPRDFRLPIWFLTEKSKWVILASYTSMSFPQRVSSIILQKNVHYLFASRLTCILYFVSFAWGVFIYEYSTEHEWWKYSAIICFRLSCEKKLVNFFSIFVTFIDTNRRRILWSILFFRIYSDDVLYLKKWTISHSHEKH